MILVDHEIRALIDSGEICVDPFDSKLINPASLDFRLGNKFGVVKSKTREIPKTVKHFGRITQSKWEHTYMPLPVDPTDPKTFEMEYIEDDKYLLAPGGFVIASSLEKITIPVNLCFMTKGKSSLGRLGLENSSMAGFVDPGWSGYITLELFNYSNNSIQLTAGMKIGQWVFYECHPPDNSYKETGRYYEQAPGEGSKGI